MVKVWLAAFPPWGRVNTFDGSPECGGRPARLAPAFRLHPLPEVSVSRPSGGAVGQPVTLIQTLACWGLGLRKAYEVVTRLVAGEKLPVLLANAPEPAEVVSTLERLGVAVGFPHPPPPST